MECNLGWQLIHFIYKRTITFYHITLHHFIVYDRKAAFQVNFGIDLESSLKTTMHYDNLSFR